MEHIIRKQSQWIFWGFAVIAAFYLLTEHRAHLFGWLPFILLAACPIMHIFMHGGHGVHRGHGGSKSDAENESSRPRSDEQHNHKQS